MINDPYPYFPISGNVMYGFISEGVKGQVFKIILFTFLGENKWNLGFGDWKNDDVDDKVMTNNEDVVRVIGTVAKVTYNFFKDYPDAVVVIDPVDEKRKKLYNIVFQRHYEAINKDFQIMAVRNDQKEIYSPITMYDGFELSLKSK